MDKGKHDGRGDHDDSEDSDVDDVAVAVELPHPTRRVFDTQHCPIVVFLLGLAVDVEQ